MKRIPFLSPVLAVLLTALVVLTPSASAQTATTTLPGITVAGYGEATAPAGSAMLVLMFSSENYSYTEEPMEDVDTPATPTPSTSDAARTAIDALVANGVPESDIQLIDNPFIAGYGPYPAPTIFTLIVSITNPTSAGISDLITVTTDAAATGGLYATMYGALYGGSDCAALQRQARAAAIEDAREQAATQAELLDVTLGSVTASRDSIYGAASYSGMYGPASMPNGCTLPDGFDKMTAIYNAPAFDPSFEPSVTVSASIELTFAIEPAVS